MIGLRITNTSFTPTKLPFLNTETLSKKNTILCLCKSDNASGGEDGGEASPSGDTRQQELLAKLAMLQTQKLRLTDYLDERSEYLTQFAEEANAEFDQIGEDAMKGLDEAGTRIMEKIESQMQAFEESAEQNRKETQKKEQKLKEFEGQVESGRNEGLFFKSLRQKTPEDKAKAKEETQKIKKLTKGTAGSKPRRAIYLTLMGLLTVGIADALASSTDWRKVAVLGVIWVALLTQFTYEQRISSLEEERIEKEKVQDEKK